MTDTPSDAGLDLGRGRTSPTPGDREASTWDPSELDGDRLREECGVFGIFGHPDAAAITALGLHALQHRGQEAAGIVSFIGPFRRGYRAVAALFSINCRMPSRSLRP